MRRPGICAHLALAGQLEVFGVSYSPRSSRITLLHPESAGRRSGTGESLKMWNTSVCQNTTPPHPISGEACHPSGPPPALPPPGAFPPARAAFWSIFPGRKRAPNAEESAVSASSSWGGQRDYAFQPRLVIRCGRVTTFWSTEFGGSDEHHLQAWLYR